MNIFNLIDTETDGGRYDVTPLFSNWKMPAGLGKEVPYKKSCDDGNKEK